MSLDRTRPPDPGAIRPFEFPAVASAELGNGLGLRIARMARLPVVTVYLVLRAGEARLEDGRAGLAILTGDALEGGTRRRSGAELAEALEGIGAGLSVSTGWDATTVSLTCLADRLESALPLLTEAVLEPAFPEDEVARTRGQRLARIEERRKDPGSLASDAAARFIFDGGHPYSRPLGGIETSVAAMGPEDVAGFADEAYRPEGAGLVVVGDVDAAEMEALASRHFGEWSGRPPSTSPSEPEPRSRERRVHLVHRPGSVQSEIRVGHVGAPRTSDDYFALLVLNTVLGGSFTSRLNLNLRERHGYTYGARTHFSFRSQAGPFEASTAVETGVTPAAVREIVNELEAIARDGPEEEEAEAARDYAAGVFPLRLETTSQVGARVAELLVYGLADDYWTHYRERIRAVGADDLLAAARRHVRPDEAAVVVVGDADEVREPLEALELGPVEVHDGL